MVLMCCSLTTDDRSCHRTQVFLKWKWKQCCLDLLIWIWSLQKSAYPDCVSTAGILRVIFLMFSSLQREQNVWQHLEMFPLWQRGSSFMHQVEKKQRSYNIKYSQWCRNVWNISREKQNITLLFQQTTRKKEFYFLCDNSVIWIICPIRHILVEASMLKDSTHCLYRTFMAIVFFLLRGVSWTLLNVDDALCPFKQFSN